MFRGLAHFTTLEARLANYATTTSYEETRDIRNLKIIFEDVVSVGRKKYLNLGLA